VNSETRYIGTVNIEAYAPFFYTISESDFLKDLDNFFIIAGILFVLLSIVVSIYLAATIARPIVRAKNAARQISGGDFRIKIPDKHFTIELHELALSVNDLSADLLNGEKWQKRLTSDIAHELRTPLTTLQGNIDAIIEGVWEPTPEHLESCSEEIERLHKLVEDLSMLSILERDIIVLHKTNFNLDKLISRAVQQFVPLANEKGIALTAELFETPIYADYDRLMQVMINLISNAVKYTDAGKITVTVKRNKQNGQIYYEITVADTGIGIPEKDLPHIFKRLYRSDKSRGRLTGGFGIGLSIASAIVEAHGGKITAESNDTGSIFKVEL
jgi:signal transduction histidine kinase